MAIKNASTISVDIGHSNLKIIQTGSDGRILRFAVHKMPEGCVDDLNIYSEDALIRSLRTARKTSKIPSGKCTLVLCGSDIIIRHFTLPILPENELYQNVINEISGYLPVNPEKYYLDYKIVGKVQEDGIDMYSILITAVHKHIINGYKRALRSAGFNVNVIDTCENAREKLLRFNNSADENFSIDDGICILDLGTKYTRVTLYHNGNYYISSVLKRSSQGITDVISKNSGKDMLLSETIKREIDFLGAPHSNAELKAAVTYEVDSLMYEITRVFDYYKNRTKRSVNKIFLSGGGSLLPGLKVYMQKHINVPVHFASDLIITKKTSKNVDLKGFAFLLNAYAATFREDTR